MSGAWISLSLVQFVHFIDWGWVLAKHNGKIFSEVEWCELLTQLSLPPRQEQIVKHIFDGLGDKQIAGKLGICVPTVRTHLSRLFARLDVQDRHELSLEVFRQFRASCPVNCPRQR